MKELKLLLEVLNSVGVEEVVLEPTKEGDKTLVRGASRDANVIVFDTIDEVISEHVIAVQSVKGLLSRINLFPDDGTQMKETAKDGVVNTLTFKKGRRTASFRCAKPKTLNVPEFVPGDLSIKDPFIFDSDYVDYISSAISAMSLTGSKSERNISMEVDDGLATLRISDGEEDSFSDSFETAKEAGDNYAWEASPFQRVMKEARKYVGEARFAVVDGLGVAVFDLGIVDVALTPISQ